MKLRSQAISCVIAFLALASAARAAECGSFAPVFGPAAFSATTTVSGPLLSSLPCGGTDCATFAIERVTGRKVDAKTARDLTAPTTTYLRWNGRQLQIGDGENWSDLVAPPAAAAAGDPAAHGIAVTCHSGGEVTIDGQAATLYVRHVEGKGLAIDTTAWIAKASGLPLKAIQQIKGGRVSVTTYDYGAYR